MVRGAGVALLVVSAACADTKEQKIAKTIAAVRAESATAVSVATRPTSVLWDVDRVSERLVRSGVAPRRMKPAPDVPKFFASAKETGGFLVGRDGELRVYVFADSVARRRVTDSLDAKTVSPPGTHVWHDQAMLIVAQNMAAVLLRGNGTLQERVQLALEAGLPGK